MFPILEFREITPADHQFWENVELDLNISMSFYVKNVLLYVYCTSNSQQISVISK